MKAEAVESQAVRLVLTAVSQLLDSPVVQSIGGLAAVQYLMNRRYTVEDVESVKVIDEPGHWGVHTVAGFLYPQFVWVPERSHIERVVRGTARIPVIDGVAGATMQASLASSAVISSIGGLAGLAGGIKGIAGLLK